MLAATGGRRKGGGERPRREQAGSAASAESSESVLLFQWKRKNVSCQTRGLPGGGLERRLSFLLERVRRCPFSLLAGIVTCESQVQTKS